VLRGGAWNNTAENCRSAYRNNNHPTNRNNNLGFRVVLAPSSVGKAEGKRPKAEVQLTRRCSCLPEPVR
jgi:hypothetical protein